MSRPAYLASLALAAAGAVGAQTPSSSISNLSTLGTVGQNGGALVTGFVVVGTAPKTILVRAVGPELSTFGVPNPAASVGVSIYNASGSSIAARDPSQPLPATDPAVQVAAAMGAFPLTRAGNAAIVVSLLPGAYTIQGAPGAGSSANGTALLEVYDVNALAGANNVFLGAADNATTVTVPPGALITLTLQTNPSTGYSWINLSGPDSNVLGLIATTQQPPLVVRAGSPSTRMWAYRAVGSGTTTLAMAYDRFVGPDTVTAYSITVVVQ